MKFLLLASGPIAENIIRHPSFLSRVKRDLVGLVGSDAIIELVSYYKNVETLGINLSKKNEDGLIDLILSTKPDYILSIQYPWILSQNIIDLMAGKVLNLHNAKLPDFRGHNSLSHEILNCETRHTSTLHWVSAEVDRGSIVFTKQIEIFEEDTAYSLWKRSTISCFDVLEQWFEYLAERKCFPGGVPVRAGGRFYSKDISRFKKIPDGAGPEMISRWSRAFWFPPHEPAYMEFEGKKFYVLPKIWIYKDL